MIARNPNEKKETNVKPVLIGALAFLIIGGIIGGTIFLAGKGKKTPSASENSVATESSNTVAEGIGSTEEPETVLQTSDQDAIDFIAQLDPNATDIRSLILDTTPITTSNINDRFPKEEDKPIIDQYVYEKTEYNILKFFNILACIDNCRSEEMLSWVNYFYTNVGSDPDGVVADEGAYNVMSEFASYSDGSYILNLDFSIYYPEFVYYSMRSNSNVDFYSCLQNMKTMTPDDLSYKQRGDTYVTDSFANSPLLFSFVSIAYEYPDANDNISEHEFEFGAPSTAGEDLIAYPEWTCAGGSLAYVVPVKDLTSNKTFIVAFDSENQLIGIDVY